MRGSNSSSGYTVIEVLIFIAVSAVMFVMAAVSFGGRQSEVQFSQAVRDFDSKIQDLVNDVSTGYFPNDASIDCLLPNPSDPNERPDPQVVGAGDPQGESANCVSIGKVLQFYPAGTDDSTINVYNVIGRRKNQNNRPTNSLSESRPVLIADFSTEALSWGLKVTKIDLSGSDYGSIGFFTSFSTSFTSGGISQSQISNNQRVRYGVIDGTALMQPRADLISTANTITDDSAEGGSSTFVDLSGSIPVTICVQNAAEDKRASIVIGEDRTTSTSVHFDDYDRVICGT